MYLESFIFPPSHSLLLPDPKPDSSWAGKWSSKPISQMSNEKVNDAH